MVCFFRRDDGRVRRQHEVDTGVGHQVGLELGYVNVERTVKSQGSCQRRYHLSHKAVEVGVRWALDVQVTAAHVIESLIVEAEGAVGVFQKGVGRKHGVVGFHNRCGHLRKFEFVQNRALNEGRIISNIQLCKCPKCSEARTLGSDCLQR